MTYVGKLFICLRKFFRKIVITESTPISVSIASSGTPRPVHTEPVIVWKLSVYG